MNEYGVSLRELDEYWTPSRTLLYSRRISERHLRQRKSGSSKPVREMSKDELINSEFMKG